MLPVQKQPNWQEFLIFASFQKIKPDSHIRIKYEFKDIRKQTNYVFSISKHDNKHNNKEYYDKKHDNNEHDNNKCNNNNKSFMHRRCNFQTNFYHIL